MLDTPDALTMDRRKLYERHTEEHFLLSLLSRIQELFLNTT